MADQKPAEREAREDAAPKPGGGKKKFAIIGLISGVMIVEGVAIFVATRFLAGSTPVPASAAGLEGGGGFGEAGKGHGAPPAPTEKEVVVAQFRAMNDRTGRNIIYDVKVYGRVAGDKVEPVQKLVEEKKATIEDRMTKVIRAADPQFFKEPGLETLRRQIKHEVDAALGENNGVQEILIPSLMWYSADG